MGWEDLGAVDVGCSIKTAPITVLGILLVFNAPKKEESGRNSQGNEKKEEKDAST